MSRARHASALLALLLLPVGCRDASDPFRPTDRPPIDGSVVRVTYSPNDDRMPAWSAGSDSVYFVAAGWDGNPESQGTVLSAPLDGTGPAVELLTNVQAGVLRRIWITTPAITPARDRVAYVRVPPLLDDAPCDWDRRVCPLEQDSLLSMVRLVRAGLHVRAIDSEEGIEQDLMLPLAFAGHSVYADPDAPMGMVTVSEFHPFQLEFERRGRLFFRPSWSPDGTRLVLSDGLRLLVWTPGAADPVPVPETDDGVMPAWSPNGEWIAYARYQRIAAETFDCDYQSNVPNVGFVTDCVERRTIHYYSDPVIVLTRPDGSEATVLGFGTEPAWSPDGATIYATRGAETTVIVGMRVDGSAEFEVPGTSMGVEPAVSPDGHRLAFARGSEDSHDIWVVELP